MKKGWRLAGLCAIGGYLALCLADKFWRPVPDAVYIPVAILAIIAVAAGVIGGKTKDK
nr:hypothetical protein [bacterium]